MNPFIKWPGGKRWLVPKLMKLLGDTCLNGYFEPFLGGGAVLFGLHIRPATAGDINGDLMNVYRQVAAVPGILEARLKSMPVDAVVYDRVKRARYDDPIDQAVRFLYLNRTAFAGMYRLNRQGVFNVPYGGGGRTPEPLWRDGLLSLAAEYLKDVTLLTGDFEDILAPAGAGDLVYCDPTYTVAHNNNGFVRYNERNFSWADQERLAESCKRLASRGATVVVSNAASEDVRRLYPSAGLHVVERKSLLSPRPGARRTTTEYLFILTPSRGNATPGPSSSSVPSIVEA